MIKGSTFFSDQLLRRDIVLFNKLLDYEDKIEKNVSLRNFPKPRFHAFLKAL